MNIERRGIRLLGIAVLQFVGCGIFIFAFFPSPTPTPAVSRVDKTQRTPAVYDRLVLMVVDGLPSELVFDTSKTPTPRMPNAIELMKTGAGLGFRLRARTPTVTLPRLKAITAGIVSTFMDVVYNFAASALTTDSWVQQMHSQGKVLVVHGDKTWPKLFPTQFARSSLVSDLYVKDTSEVDYNVTSQLDFELKAQDWDVLVLHYLGVDHAGHVGGRHGPLMAPKLQEMDKVLARIHQSLELDYQSRGARSLLLLVSDHGMTTDGGHGGGSFQETDTVALFLGSPPLVSQAPGSGGGTKTEGDRQANTKSDAKLGFGVGLETGSTHEAEPVGGGGSEIAITRDARSPHYESQLEDASAAKQWRVGGSKAAQTVEKEICSISCSGLTSGRKLAQGVLDACAGPSAGSDAVDTWVGEQVDVAPTIAALMGVAIPRESVGAVLPEVLNKLPQSVGLEVVKSNTLQIRQVLKSGCQKEQCANLLADLSRLETQPVTAQTISDYQAFLKEASELLQSVSTQDLGPALAGAAFLIIAAFAAILECLSLSNALDCPTTQAILASPASRPVSSLDGQITIELCVLHGMHVLHAMSFAGSSYVEEEHYTVRFLTVTVLLLHVRHLLKRGNSAAFEQSTRSQWASIVPNSHVAHVAMILLLSRVLWSWHSGGIEWASQPDVAKWMQTHLAAPQMLTAQLLAICMAACLTVGLFVYSPICLRVSSMQSSVHASQAPIDQRGLLSSPSAIRDRLFLVVLVRFFPCALVTCATFMVGVIALWTKCVSADLMDSMDQGTLRLVDTICPKWMLRSAPPSELVWTIYFLLALSTLLPKCAGYASACGYGVMSTASNSTLAGRWDARKWSAACFFAAWCTLQLLIQESTNTIAMVLMYLQAFLASHVLSSCSSNPLESWDAWVCPSIMNWLGWCGFFDLGNTNSFATLSISNAFMGFGPENRVGPAFVVFFGTYAGPTLFSLAAGLPINSIDSEVNKINRHVMLPVAMVSLKLAVCTLMLVVHSEHLFIWSVFAPKFAYMCMSTLAVWWCVSLWIVLTSATS